MVGIVKTGIIAKRNGRQFKTNLCETPNGTLVANCGIGYFKVNSKYELTGKSWYVGSEKGYEIWQEDKLDKDGYYKIREKKVKIK